MPREELAARREQALTQVDPETVALRPVSSRLSALGRGARASSAAGQLEPDVDALLVGESER